MWRGARPPLAPFALVRRYVNGHARPQPVVPGRIGMARSGVYGFLSSSPRRTARVTVIVVFYDVGLHHRCRSMVVSPPALSSVVVFSLARPR
jgi:hypothetical protein